MRYRLLGRSGLRVSELCLGTMTFGEEWQFGASIEQSRAIFDRFCAAGGTFVDTANVYTCGTSEKLVGELIASDRDHFVVSTKFSLTTRPDDQNGGGNHRKSMVQAVERSLRQLGTGYIDIYWLHAWDATTPLDEVMRGLDDLARSGKALYIGVSDTPAWVVSQANTVAELRGWSSFIGLQTEYNLIERTAERELLPMARAFELGVLAWAPLAGGVLTGKYTLAGDEVRFEDSLRGGRLNGDRLTLQSMQVAATVMAIATESGRAPAQVALNWLRQHSAAAIIPIISARTVTQIEQNLGCLGFTLDNDQMGRLDAVSEVTLGFPHQFLASAPLQRALFGTNRDLLELPSRMTAINRP